MGYFERDYYFSDLCGSNAEHTPKLPNRQVGLIAQNATPQSQVSNLLLCQCVMRALDFCGNSTNQLPTYLVAVPWTICAARPTSLSNLATISVSHGHLQNWSEPLTGGKPCSENNFGEFQTSAPRPNKSATGVKSSIESTVSISLSLQFTKLWIVMKFFY